MAKDVKDVQAFWERNPLFVGESQYNPGSREFFDGHRRIVIDDVFAGHLDKRILPDSNHCGKVLDLGCGIGVRTVELGTLGCQSLTAADLTDSALRLTKKRCSLFGVKADLKKENAEDLSFRDGSFSHVNCLGVIHHTPNTKICVSEISRVLEKNGTACISVYYWNFLIRGFPLIKGFAKLIGLMGGNLKGRGREDLFKLDDVEEIIRQYDGQDNPIGKAYSKQEFLKILAPHFNIEEVFLHFFPARALPFPLPISAHRFLDKVAGFMIFARLTKR